MREEGSAYLPAFLGTQTCLLPSTFYSGASPHITGEKIEGLFLFSIGRIEFSPMFCPTHTAKKPGISGLK